MSGRLLFYAFLLIAAGVLVKMMVPTYVIRNDQGITIVRFSGPWRYDFHEGIMSALAAAQVRNCKYYRYQPNIFGENEFLIHCSSDKQHWVGYMVWPKTSKVLGPAKVD
ncbi:hypothetical protein [Pseudomonas mangiferae]|uniref:Uncharacterized protein n=1 Tax=Pseudomonas mangiferae TaxID=2593654 RepID=A0A553GV89_9PSED|nr:hypothetical protein [Pseudomonas mangiferae]TRX73375.1 hypothetical protein FM069_18155 [Pseudomonas mangiferae]